MTEIWKAQKKHLCCLQDPPGVQLYMQTGTLQKGGRTLPTYRCARGSTSLESFHLHMNRFIPGTLAGATFFQAYLVDGLARWNEDMGMALAEEVIGRRVLAYTPPQRYTGELIGVEYLYHQTGRALEDYKLTLAALETEEVSVAKDEGYVEPEVEELEDFTVPILEPPPLAGPTATHQCVPSACHASHQCAPSACHSTHQCAPSACHASHQCAPSACHATHQCAPGACRTTH
ncbi:uncharacterized protein LOC120567393 [Perca fluviatilis]|uniref:uncharacterized protein LOC120567393 n=1 Tax=Perca fluviatilis TaxID=8168 RepID=UPI0019640B9C|nr:uncharacterized protein LOC120567393 [Perca fluviatilis]